MKTSLPLACLPRHALSLRLLGAISVSLPAVLQADPTGDPVAVYSIASPGYSRPRSAQGFKTETYAFGEGGRQTGPTNDETIDRLRFVDVARRIAPSLAAQNYIPCDPKQPNKTDLLVMVYWGSTVGTDRTSSSAEYQIAQGLVLPPAPAMSPAPTGLGGTEMTSDPMCNGRRTELQAITAIKYANDSALEQSLQMSTAANRARDHRDFENARVLGYLSELERVNGYGLGARAQLRRDVIDEIEESRYYVVLIAYDFQALLQHREKRRLWETRFSVRERRNDFGRSLAAMAQSASRYFGQNTTGLVRQPLPDGHVELGELNNLGPEQ